MTLQFGLEPEIIESSNSKSGAISKDQWGNNCKVVREASTWNKTFNHLYLKKQAFWSNDIQLYWWFDSKFEQHIVQGIAWMLHECCYFSIHCLIKILWSTWVITEQQNHPVQIMFIQICLKPASSEWMN